MLLGGTEKWDPEKYLSANHPDACVRRGALQRPLMACVDHRRRIIWLARHLDPVQQHWALTYEVAHLEHGPAPADQRLAVLHARSCGDWAARMLIDDIGDLCVAYAVNSHLPAGDLYREIAALLNVDEQAVRYRLRGLTDAEQDAVTDAVRNMPVAV